MMTNVEMSVLGDLITESSIDAIIALGNDDEVMIWNNAATMLFGITKDDAVGKTLAGVLPSVKTDAYFIAAIKLAKEGKKSFLPSSGDFFHRSHFETHIIPLKNDTAAIGVMLLIHDVSHRIIKEKELEELNSELQKRIRQLNLTTYELANLTHIATHNIKEPIRTIYTAVEFLVQSEARTISNNGRASFRRIQSALTRISLLLDDIITLTQINIAQQPETMVNLENVIKELMASLAPKLKGNNVMLTTGDLCEIRAHRNQVALLLQHIVSNAIKFNNSDAPFVHISCCKVQHSEEKNENEKPKNYYLISITHNGYGFMHIDSHSFSEEVRKLGEQQYKHLVIASVIAAKVMEAHGGLLAIEEMNGGETMIKCYFPVDTRL